MAALGFVEYLCAQYFVKKVFGTSDNKAHLILSGTILFFCLLPRNYLFIAFFITAFLTPIIVLFGLIVFEKAGK
jgi:hypothetical protein